MVFRETPIEFMLSVNSGFPHDPKYIEMCSNIRNDMRNFLTRVSKLPTEDIRKVNYAAHLFDISSKHMIQYVKGEGTEWTSNDSNNYYGQRRTDDYPLTTFLDGSRYINSSTALINSGILFPPDTIQKDIGLTHRFESGKVKITNILAYRKDGSFPGVSNASEKTFNEHNTNFFLLHSPGRSGYEGFNTQNFATIAEMNQEINLLVGRLLAYKRGDFEEQKDLANTHRLLTHACEMVRGGSTHANIATLVIADRIGIELPLPKIGETAWFHASTQPQDEYTHQFVLGINMRRNERLKDTILISQLSDTFFDPLASKGDIYAAISKSMYPDSNIHPDALVSPAIRVLRDFGRK